MISIGAQTLIGFLLILVQTFCYTISCQNPGYLTALKNEVRQFYTLTSDPGSLGLTEQTPCTFWNGNQIWHPKLKVHTTYPWNSTCPWNTSINEAGDGLRFPCRIVTARLVWDNTYNTALVHHHPKACLRTPGSRYLRNDNKLCKGIQQMVPVVEKTGCRNGIYDYDIKNISITVGFTCTFVE